MNRKGSIISNLFLTRQMLFVSFFKDLKKSFGGLAWLIFAPLITVATWIILHSSGIVNPGQSEVPYPVYVMISTSIWSLFIGTYKSVSSTLKSYGRMLIMANVPLAALVAEKVFSEIIRFAILMVVIVITLKFLHAEIPISIFLSPFALLPLVILALNIGLINALLKIVAIDLSRILDNIMGFLMYVTPIVYTSKIKLGYLSEWIQFNPLTYLVALPRNLMTTNHLESITPFLTISALIFAITPLSWKYFNGKAKYVLERIINN